MRLIGFALAVALTACGSAAEQNVSNAAGPGAAGANEAAPEPAEDGNKTAPSADSAAEPGISLAAYVDHYSFDEVDGVTFLEHPRVRAAVVAAVPDPAIRRLILEPGTSVPIERQGGRLISHACEPHNCPHNWAILIDEAGRAAEICYHDDEDGESSRWFAAGRPVETRSGDCP